MPITKNATIAEKPARYALRCTRCGAWGHQATDRECPMRDSQGARDEAQKARATEKLTEDGARALAEKVAARVKKRPKNRGKQKQKQATLAAAAPAAAR